ncbi:DEAD/DEAH box helicase [Paenibacillus sp. J2TS4]|uniref:DEAD/DEAH box helicase n=1 Tax=Paenibacillus sp. J2TS4 TaxID=2807194 RepID=UPI001B1CBCDB|nr:DEAD/DEAH box helicase [Paenibacillus sp. J2TS4]GIP36220.1 DEAD/DEAH box helicase [Paenibacillus sp. J2TS4]
MDALASFHPVLAGWFRQSFGEPTEVQRKAWKGVAAGCHTLIASPTGSGKTLAALLPCLDSLVQSKERPAKAEPGVRVLYITPLKALNNDIHHHLFRFVEQLKQYSLELGEAWPDLKIGVRTGDTSQSTRTSMLRHPPDLLVTTPESFYLMMTSPKAREILKTVEKVIVDEIHSLAADKRGVHLTLTLERLVEWCGRSFQRIGVSATQKPLERVARFLGGWEEAGSGEENAAGENKPASLKKAADEKKAVNESTAACVKGEGITEGAAGEAGAACEENAADGNNPMPWESRTMQPRSVVIVQSEMEKRYELLVTMPDRPAPSREKELFWLSIVERIVQLMDDCRTALLFVNNRRLCERLTLRLNEHFGYEAARSHHGSVSREKRLEVERLLKEGALRCLVATSSLELGIDVGHVDRVIQIDSPKQAAAGIQRIGRAGHAVGDVSRGFILARSRGELPEAAVLARLIAARDIEEIRIPRHSLDVLSQQVTAMVAVDDWEEGQLYRALTRSDCFRGFPRGRFRGLLEVLAGLYPFARPLLDWDRDTGRLSRRAHTPMAAIMGAGTIPHSSGYPVYHMDTRQHLGELDEEFVFESRPGDVFQLGTNSWSIRSIKHDRVYVTEAENRFSEIPFWRAEALGRSYELGVRIGQFMAQLGDRAEGSAQQAQQWLMDEYALDARAAEQLTSWVRSQQAVCPLPTDRRIIVEQFTDDTRQHHVIIHSLLGRRFNLTWQLAIQAKLSGTVRRTYYANAKDNGIEFIFPEWDPVWLSLMRQVDAASLDQLLLESLPGSPMLGIAFRRIAETSLLLSKGFSRVPAWKKRLRSEGLLEEALPYADRFPFLREAVKECMEDTLDTENLKDVLTRIGTGEMEWKVEQTRFPSPFAAQFLLDYVGVSLYESDALKPDLQVQLASVSKELAAQYFGEDSLKGMIHPEALSQEKKRLERGEGLEWNGPEDLYRLLKERGDQTEEELSRLAGSHAAEWLPELAAAGRVTAWTIGDEQRWICRDEQHLYETREKDSIAATFIYKRYIDHRLSFTPEQLQSRYGLTPERTKELLASWQESGMMEPAPFAHEGKEELFTSTQVTRRMIRISIRDFRRASERVPSARFCRYLVERHRMTAGQRLGGSEGLRTVLEELQGVFLPLDQWESIVFPSRLTAYRKEELDLLLASGEWIWLGAKEENEKAGRIAFFKVEAKPLYSPFMQAMRSPAADSAHPELLQLLQAKGASFLTVLSRETGEVPSVLLDKLIDLVWEGRVSNDQLGPVRSYKQAKSARPGKFQSGLGRWYALDEWAQPDNRASPLANTAGEESALQWAHLLLKRYGAVTKETAKDAPFAWETMSGIFRRLEEWGMVTRGMFVQGVSAMQFALKETAESLNSVRYSDSELILLSASDPVNPYGATVPWPNRNEASFARKPGNYIVLCGDRWLLWLEHYGKKIWTMEEEGAEDSAARESWPEWRDLLPDLLSRILRQSGQRKIAVEQWNGQPVAETAATEWLVQSGAERDRHKIVIWPSSFR